MSYRIPSGYVRGTVSALVMVLFLLMGAGSGLAESGTKDLNELAEMFDVGDEPADFVVVLDVSGSMMNGKPGARPWDRAVASYESLLDAMRPQDRLSVVVFGTDATLIYTGDLKGKSAKSKALKQLKEFKPEPGSPLAAGTDIGKGLELGVRELSKVQHADVQSLMLMTDGKFDSPGSPFKNKGSAAWRSLRERVEGLEENGHDISAYGFALTRDTATDAGMVKEIFDDAVILAPPPSQLPGHFENLVQSSRREQVANAVRTDLDRPVAVELVVTGEVAAKTPAELVFESQREVLDSAVTIESVGVSLADGTEVDVDDLDLPYELDVPANGSAAVPLTLDIAGVEGGIEFGTSTTEYDFVLEMSAASVPTVMARLESTDILTASEGQRKIVVDQGPKIEESTGIPWWKLFVGLAALVLVAWIARRLYVKYFKLPSLSGTLTILSTNESVPLKGTEMKLPGPSAPLGETRTDEILLNTRRRKRGQVFVHRIGGDPELDRWSGWEPLPATAPKKLGSGDRLRLGTVALEFKND